MATNPIQRKARNSFLLGVVITLLITALIIVFLFMEMKKLNDQIATEKESIKMVYVANQDIKSGQVITADMFSYVGVKASGIPTDAIGDVTSLIQNYSLCDKAGNTFYNDAEGLYMLNDGEKTRVYRETATDSYYTQAQNGTKTYIETTKKALIAKIDIKMNTVLSSSFISRSNEIETDDVREQEYNVVILPTELMTGDYVDVRLMLPNGEDFIVISKKMVTIPNVAGEYLADTLKMNLSEDEILIMSSAIVEAFKINGAKLYATKYTDAGLQSAASATYVASKEVTALIDQDPNITAEAKTGLRARYSEGLSSIRNTYINGAISAYGSDENVPNKINESITSTQQSRQEYLQSLTGTTGK